MIKYARYNVKYTLICSIVNLILKIGRSNVHIRKTQTSLWSKKWKIKDFAEQTGIAYRTLQGYVEGECEANAEGMAAIAKGGVNLNWLVSGEGEMFQSEPPKTIMSDKKQN